MSRPADEPPVLRVRKDAEKEVRFHYRRDDRLAQKRPVPPQKRRGCLTRTARFGGRSLLPVLLLVLAIVVVVRLVTRERARGHLAGYDVRLEAASYQDALLASVAFTWKPRPAERAVDPAEATVSFSTTTAGAGSVVVEPLGGDETVAHGRLPYTGAERKVTAEVQIADRTVRLTVSVARP